MNWTTDQPQATCRNVADDVTCNALVQNGSCSDSAFARERCALACGFCTTTVNVSTSSISSTTTAAAAAAITIDNNSGMIHVTYVVTFCYYAPLK